MTINAAPSVSAKTLTLSITNAVPAGADQSPHHRFGPAGGSIGTAASDTWRLSAHRTGAVDGHAEIRYVDGEFCLIDRSGRTFINSASQPVGRGRRARLSQGDTVTIGRYQIRADLAAAASHGLDDIDAGTATPELMTDQPPVRASADNEPREPLAGLPGRGREAVDADPLPDWNGQGREAYPDADDRGRQHIGLRPLGRGLGVSLPATDSADMQGLLEEMGETLRATVTGLLALHQEEGDRHRALRTRLQPVEDNPLRRGESYEDTLATLFTGERSPVHLSAPAAVRDSLDSLARHQQATEAAIQEALDAILHAFSPDALLRRFHGYRRRLRDGEDEAGWAWTMYQHYYRELITGRQQGFERLFREVFEQAYDRHLRQQHRETLL